MLCFYVKAARRVSVSLYLRFARIFVTQAPSSQTAIDRQKYITGFVLYAELVKFIPTFNHSANSSRRRAS